MNYMIAKVRNANCNLPHMVSSTDIAHFFESRTPLNGHEQGLCQNYSLASKSANNDLSYHIWQQTIQSHRLHSTKIGMLTALMTIRNVLEGITYGKMQA